MRTTTAKIDAAVSGQVLVPAYLVEIGFSTTLRFCTRKTVDWGGYFWVLAGVQVGSITTGTGGAKSVSVSIPNNQFAFSQLVLSQNAAGRRLRIWKLFGEAPYAQEDAVMVFDGVIEDVPEMMDRVVLSAASKTARAAFAPNITVNPPYFNHLPRPGQTIIWGGETYELQPR